jgi:uncharacterized protein (DUF4415 family)
MKAEYDFSKSKRAKDVPHLAKLQAAASKGKTRVTIYLYDEVLAAFRTHAESQGKGYQTLINDTLRRVIDTANTPVTLESLRQVIREELHAA